MTLVGWVLVALLPVHAPQTLLWRADHEGSNAPKIYSTQEACNKQKVIDFKNFKDEYKKEVIQSCITLDDFKHMTSPKPDPNSEV